MRLFVLTPAGRIDDAAEALHQLVHKATALGYDAATVYLPPLPADPTPEPYRRYLSSVATDLVDGSDSFVIAAPSAADRLLALRAAQRGLWWLRGDRGPTDTGGIETLHDTKSRCIHLAQTEAHRLQLRGRGTASLALGDYLSRHLLELAPQLRAQPKADLVAYRAAGRGRLVEALRARSPESVHWVPLSEDDPDGAARLLAQAKVFLDLGPGAGGSRAARIATAFDCCVLAAEGDAEGHAGEQDPGCAVPERYRVPADDPGAVAQLPALIAELVQDPAAHLAQFADRRARIESQEQAFTDEVFTVLATIEAFQHRIHHLAV